VWDLSSNAMRTAGWTSADAAGLPITPLLLRPDEILAGTIAQTAPARLEWLPPGSAGPRERWDEGTGDESRQRQARKPSRHVRPSLGPSSLSATGPVMTSGATVTKGEARWPAMVGHVEGKVAHV